MKAATRSFEAEHSEHKTSKSTEGYGNASLARYTLVTVLVTALFLILSWNPSQGAEYPHIGSGFMLMWLVGGLVTLTLLVMASKRPE